MGYCPHLQIKHFLCNPAVFVRSIMNDPLHLGVLEQLYLVPRRVNIEGFGLQLLVVFPFAAIES